MGVSSEAEALCEALHYLCLRLRARPPMQQFVLLDYHFPAKPVARKNLLQGGDPRLWPKEPEREVVLRLGLLGKSLPETSPYKEGVFLLDMKILCPLGGSPATVRAVRFTGTNLYHPNVTNGYTLCHCRPDFLPHLHKQSHRMLTVLEEVAWRLQEPAVIKEEPLQQCLAHPNSIRASYISCCGIRWDAMRDYVMDRARFDRIASENARSVLIKVPQLMWLLNARPLEEQLLHEKGRRDFCVAAAHKMQEADAESCKAGPINHLKDVGELVRAAMPMGSIFTDVCLVWSRLVVEGEAESAGARPKDMTVNLADGTLVTAPAPAPPGASVVRPAEVSPRVHKPFSEQLMTMRFLRKLQTAVGKGGGSAEDGDNSGTPGKRTDGGSACAGSPYAVDDAGDMGGAGASNHSLPSSSSFFPSLPPPFACQPVNRFAIVCGHSRNRFRPVPDASSTRPPSATAPGSPPSRPTSAYGGPGPPLSPTRVSMTSTLSKSPPPPPAAAPPPAALIPSLGPAQVPTPCFLLSALSSRLLGSAPLGSSSFPYSELMSASTAASSATKSGGTGDGLKGRKARDPGGGKEDKRAAMGGTHGGAAGGGAGGSSEVYRETMQRTWVYREGEDYEGFCVLVLSRKDLSVISYERFSVSHPRGLEKALAALSAEDVIVALHCTSWLRSPDVQARVDWLQYNSPRSLPDVMKRCCATKWDQPEMGSSFSMICIPGQEEDRGHCREGPGSIDVTLVWNPYTGEYEILMPESSIEISFRPPLLSEPSNSRTWVHADALMQVHLHQRRLDLARAFLFWATEGISVMKDPSVVSLRQWLTFTSTVGIGEQFPNLSPGVCVRVFFGTQYDRQLRARQQGMERIGSKPTEYLPDWNPRYYITWHEFQEALVRLAYYACVDPRVLQQRATAEAAAAATPSTSPAGTGSNPSLARSMSKLAPNDASGGGGSGWGPDAIQGPSLAMWGAALVSVLRMAVTERLRFPEGSFEEEYKSPAFCALLKFRGREINRVFKERCGRIAKGLDFIVWGEMVRKCGLCGMGVSLSRIYRIYLLANGGAEALVAETSSLGLMTRQGMCWALARLSHEIYEKECAAKYHAQTSAAAHAQALAYAHAAAQSPLSRLEEVLDAARAAAGSPVAGRGGRDSAVGTPRAADGPSSPFGDKGSSSTNATTMGREGVPSAGREGGIPMELLAGSIAELWKTSHGNNQARSNPPGGGETGTQGANAPTSGLSGNGASTAPSGQPLWERRTATHRAAATEATSAPTSPRVDATGSDSIASSSARWNDRLATGDAAGGPGSILDSKTDSKTLTGGRPTPRLFSSGPITAQAPSSAALASPPPAPPGAAKPSLRRLLSRPPGGMTTDGDDSSIMLSPRQTARLAKSTLSAPPATQKLSGVGASAAGGGSASAMGGEPSTWELPWENLPVQSTVFPPEFIPRPAPAAPVPATSLPSSPVAAAAGGASSSNNNNNNNSNSSHGSNDPSLVLKFDFVLMCIVFPCLRVAPRVNKFYLTALALTRWGAARPSARKPGAVRPVLTRTRSTATSTDGAPAGTPSSSSHARTLPLPFGSQQLRATSSPAKPQSSIRDRPDAEETGDTRGRRGRRPNNAESTRSPQRNEDGDRDGARLEVGDEDEDELRPRTATGEGYHPRKATGKGAESAGLLSAETGLTLGEGMLKGQMPLFLPRRLHAPVRYREAEAERRLAAIPEDLVEKRGTSDGRGVDIVALYTLLDRPLPPSLHHLEAHQKAMRSHQASVLAQKERESETAASAATQGGAPPMGAQPPMLAASPSLIRRSDATNGRSDATNGSWMKAAQATKGVTFNIPPVQLPPVGGTDASRGAVESPRGNMGHGATFGGLVGGQGVCMSVGQAVEALSGSRTAHF
eukprot:jgi/Mesvir1/19654/Mv09934-RA.1